jgi:hypothetical protein
MISEIVLKASAQGVTILPGGTTDLANKIRSGDIHLSDLPAFLSYFIETAIVLAGIVAFIMLLVGGYQYIIGGVYSDMREQGKTTLFYAIAGFVLSLLAYGIVNLVQLAATSL